MTPIQSRYLDVQLRFPLASYGMHSPEEVPFFVAHLALLLETEEREPEERYDPAENLTELRVLYGTLASSAHVQQDLQGRPAIYFVFPDVSIRFTGRYRLRIDLMKLAL